MSHDGSILDAHTVEFKRLLPGPIELAWDYLTKPEMLKTWFADVTLEPRVGGKIEIRFGPRRRATQAAFAASSASSTRLTSSPFHGTSCVLSRMARGALWTRAKCASSSRKRATRCC
jgi:hypothetical protein